MTQEEMYQRKCCFSNWKYKKGFAQLVTDQLTTAKLCYGISFRFVQIQLVGIMFVQGTIQVLQCFQEHSKY